MATPPDQIRVGAPVGQTPPVPAATGATATSASGGGPPLQLPMPQGGAINVFTEEMAQRLANLMALAGTRELGRLGFNVVWNADRPDIVERARQATDEMFGSIIQTAGQRVKDFFARQLESGKAPPQIADALSGQFAGVPGRQARMVARTVTRQLYNEASLDAYEAAGVRHVIASDGHGGLTGKTDAGCVARNGQQFTLDEARAEEHSPTTHPNCTLSWRPVVPDTGLRSEDVIGDAVFEHDGHRLLTLVWEPDRHPRWPKGSPHAGEWMHITDLFDQLERDAPGRRDLSWLAKGAQRIRSIHGSAQNGRVELHVEMRDGSAHTIAADRDTPITTISRALGALDAATPATASPDEPDRTEEKDLRDIEAGERFRLVSDPTKLYDTYERVTKGPSQRTDRRITVRNTRTGKRVHMQPDRRIDHFTAEPEPQTARVADLAKGDRFFVGDREYERITEGPSKRGDGRITGRELATGKRVHFKPDREVQRRRSTKPPDVKPPEPKPRGKRTDISKPPKGHAAINTLKVGDEFIWPERDKRYRVVEIRGKLDRQWIAAPVGSDGELAENGNRVDFGYGEKFVRPVEPITLDDRTKKPPVEMPAEYDNLPRDSESLNHLRVRLEQKDGPIRAPDGYLYARIPASAWESGDKTIKMPKERFGVGRIYGSLRPQDAHEGGVVVLVERQAHQKTPYMRDADLSFASISRKNVVAAWNDQGEQTFYRAPAVPAEKKPGKLVVGRRYPAAQIPEGSKVRFDGKQWELRHVEHGVSLHRTTSDGSATNALLAPTDLVTYGVVEQNFPRDRIRATEKVVARRVDQGELISLDGLVYQRTGITRKGDHVGVHLQLVGDRSAPIVRVPLDQELDAIQLTPPKGKMFAARNLAVGDTFRDHLGEWRVTERERGKAGAITIRAVTPEAPEGAPYDRYLGGRDSVLPGLTEPAANGRIFLWEIPDGAHFTIHEGSRQLGYRMLREAGGRAGQYEVEDLQTGRDHMLYARGVPNATLGLPEGVEPLPPRVEVPGTRLRDFSGDKFSVGAVRYQRTIANGPRGTISAYNLVGSDDERDQLHHLPASTLVVPDGERDPYGSGAQRQQNLIDKAAEVYESRRVLATLQEFQDAGAIVHAAILAPFEAGSGPDTPDALRRELRDVLGQIRGYGRQRFNVTGVEGADTDARGRSVALHPPNLQDEAKIEEASRWLPDSWVEHVNENHGTNVGVGPQLGRAFYRHFGLIGKGRMVAVSANERQNVVLHEFVHRVEHELPEMMRLASEFWSRRTAGEPDTPIYGGRDEITKEDHFHQRYAGKRYGYRGGGEILSMGIEDLVHPMNRGSDNRVYRLATARPGIFNILRDDPDYAHFLLGLLAAYKTERETEQRVAG